jgi:hypothetical protein
VGAALQAGPVGVAVPYMTPGGAGAVQRHAEVCRVAEVVHFKVCTLLLHQQRFVEALQQLRDHLATYATLPGEGRCMRLWCMRLWCCYGCGLAHVAVVVTARQICSTAPAPHLSHSWLCRLACATCHTGPDRLQATCWRSLARQP